MSLPWTSNSTKEGSGNFEPPTPNVSDGRPDPASSTGAIAPQIGFGFEWNPPSASPEHVTTTFPTTGGGIYEGGNSKDRK